ncbi:MAG: hypothetical protein FJZ89_03065 [Chloroflexi bacterium]|nr:hypothetical protein [Chloroflexota bacterium]
MTIDEYLLRLENNLLTGSARWVADFTESFRHYKIEDTVWDMVVRGHMRGKGLFLSRLFAYLSLPNYQVACFVYTRELGDSDLRRMARHLLGYMKGEELDWCWLVLPREGPFSSRLQVALEKIDYRELGIALVNISSREIFTNPSYVGRRLRDHVKCFR